MTRQWRALAWSAAISLGDFFVRVFRERGEAAEFSFCRLRQAFANAPERDRIAVKPNLPR
jgi:hypothetical protein